MQQDTEISIENLIRLREFNDVSNIHEYFKESLYWEGNYKDIKKTNQESWRWTNTKGLKEAVDADKVDYLGYAEPTGFSGVVFFRTSNADVAQKLDAEIAQKMEFHTEVTNDFTNIKNYGNKFHIVQVARFDNFYSIAVMSKKDWDKGLRIT